jgi:hypothetical protein
MLHVSCWWRPVVTLPIHWHTQTRPIGTREWWGRIPRLQCCRRIYGRHSAPVLRWWRPHVSKRRRRSCCCSPAIGRHQRRRWRVLWLRPLEQTIPHSTNIRDKTTLSLPLSLSNHQHSNLFTPPCKQCRRILYTSTLFHSSLRPHKFNIRYGHTIDA